MTLTVLGDAESEYVGAKVIDTLSKLAVTTEDGSLALTASPAYTFCAMAMFCVAPSCSQFTPSLEI